MPLKQLPERSSVGPRKVPQLTVRSSIEVHNSLCPEPRLLLPKRQRGFGKECERLRNRFFQPLRPGREANNETVYLVDGLTSAE
jgi:hypothetical protein